MKNINILTVLGIIFLLGNYSCSDYLDEVPKSLISPENFYQSESDALASLYSAYDKLGSGSGVYYRHFRDITLMLSDEGYGNPALSVLTTMNAYNYDSRNIMITELWQFSYESINRANATVENVSQMDFNEERKNQIVGEARYIRALNYFNLVRFFGEVPLKLTETKSLDNIAQETSSIADIYNAIIEDLAFAEDNMGIRKRGTSDANGRADQGAAKMLLAKVYMTMAGYPLKDQSKWALALQKAKELYNMTDDFGFGLWDNYLDSFEPSSENGKEDIFSIQFKSGLGAPFTGEGSLQHIDNFWAVAGRRGNKLNRPTVRLKNMFEPDDERGIALPNYRMVNGTKYNLGQDEYMFYKFVEQDIVDNNTPPNDGEKNFPVFRYSDLLLMCAELENHVNGPTEFAYQCLNQVRTRSEASEVSGLSQEEFQEFVLDERMRELYNEGHRWFDLVRYQILEREVSEAQGINFIQTPGLATEKNYWLPYPADELSYNPNIQQREGY